MLKEFKKFAVKGNVVDMAVGIMIGAAFTTVVKSLVNDILMPPIGIVMGGVDFSDKFVVLMDGKSAPPYATLVEAQEAGAVLLSYGQFINAALNFFIVAGALFFVVRWINQLNSPDTPPAPSSKPCPYCKSVVHVDASRCPNCTSELAVSPGS